MMNVVPSGKKPKPRICSLSLISSGWRPGVDIRSARSRRTDRLISNSAQNTIQVWMFCALRTVPRQGLWS